MSQGLRCGQIHLFSRRFRHHQTSTDLSTWHNLSLQKDRLKLLCPVRALIMDAA